MKIFLSLAALAATAAQAAVLPSSAEVDAHAVACKLDTDQVTWRPGERQIVALFVMSTGEKDSETDRARAGGACMEAWAKTLGLHPVLTVQIPEGH